MNSENSNSPLSSTLSGIQQRMLAVVATTLLLSQLRAIPEMLFAFQMGSIPLLQLFLGGITISLCILLYRLQLAAIPPACLIMGYTTYTAFWDLSRLNSGNADYYHSITEIFIEVILVFMLLYVFFATIPKKPEESTKAQEYDY